MSPFDIKQLILAKHAQHVVLVHFPIALCIVGVAFDFGAQLTKRTMLAATAYYNLGVAALSTPPVLVTGLLAWQLQFEGHKLKGLLLLHLVLGIVASTLIWLAWYAHFRARREKDQSLPSYRLFVEAIAVAVIMVTAHLGGFLSGVNGIR
jgi:uncharacterized membrane protein